MTFSASGEPAFHSTPAEDVLGVLAEDHHVHVAGLLHRAGHAFEPAYRALADVEIELLAQGHVQGADAATDRGGQRALDGNHVVAYGVQGFLGSQVSWS